MASSGKKLCYKTSTTSGYVNLFTNTDCFSNVDGYIKPVCVGVNNTTYYVPLSSCVCTGLRWGSYSMIGRIYVLPDKATYVSQQGDWYSIQPNVSYTMHTLNYRYIPYTPADTYKSYDTHLGYFLWHIAGCGAFDAGLGYTPDIFPTQIKLSGTNIGDIIYTRCAQYNSGYRYSYKCNIDPSRCLLLGDNTQAVFTYACYEI